MGKRYTKQDIIDQARAVHGNKYSYDKMFYRGKRENITVTCPEHGDFEIIADNHIRRKDGCKYCNGFIPPDNPTQEFCRKWYHYDEDTGIVSNRATKKEVGYKQPNAYIRMGIGGRYIDVHRFAFFYMLGKIPEEVDHRDRDPSNNAWANLRATTPALNKSNRAHSGVELLDSGSYRARINYEGEAKHLGTFALRTDAEEAVKKFKQQIYQDMEAYHNTFIT